MENKTVKKKQTQGRRKIEIKKIDNVSHRHVAFSKRRLGLFNKASELCILCGTQVVAIVESYGGKRVFTFGHPSADAVIERYLSKTPRPASDQEGSEWDAQEENSVQHYHRAWQELAAEKKEKERIQEEIGGGGGYGVGHWWNLPIEDMPVTELQEYAAALEELKKKAASRVDELEPPATLIMNNNTNNIINNDNNLSCSLLPSSSSSEMLTNNNDHNDIVDDCFGSLLPAGYDDGSHYYLEYIQN